MRKEALLYIGAIPFVALLACCIIFPTYTQSHDLCSINRQVAMLKIADKDVSLNLLFLPTLECKYPN
jgi:hypothetical protein